MNARMHRAEVRGMVVLAVVATIGSAGLLAQTAGQKTFSSSKDALNAFVQAVSAGNSAELTAILGEGSEAIISSGDPVADKAAGEHFVAEYNAKHALVPAGGHNFTLNYGADDYPLPIPLVNNGGKWYFDGAAGKEEILYRRIGKNELAAIDVCKGVLDAQRDYAASAHDGQPVGTYAQHVMSTPGKQDGLYWETKPGEPQSPAGPLLADASSQGYTTGKGVPYHGYYYKMIENPGGFALLAFPAEYHNSGVMTFVVTQSGVVYQKDLGKDTVEIAQRINRYQMDGTWTAVQ
jgi:hypothetical protein